MDIKHENNHAEKRKKERRIKRALFATGEAAGHRSTVSLS
jgi:hypothetical protein